MLAALTDRVVRHPVLVLVLAGLGVVLAAVLGSQAVPRLAPGGFTDTGAPSAVAAAALSERFAEGGPDLVLVVAGADGRRVADPAVAAAGRSLADRLAAEPGLSEVRSPWTTPAPGLRSDDGTLGLVTARVAGDDSAQSRVAERVAASYGGVADGLDVTVGGRAAVFAEVGSTIERDLARAEAVAVPLTFLLLLLAFGTVVAAGLPLAVGAVSVTGALLVLWLLTRVTDVSVYALNLTTSLGLGLAIDYALLLVTRYREELAAGHDVPVAVRRTVSSAGRTVLFSGLTVAVSLAALLVFPQFFLRSFAYAGIAVTLLAMLGAVVVLPAVLALLGTRVNRLRVLRPRAKAVDAQSGFWFRLSTAVMRRPWAFLGVGLSVLVLLGLPFLRVAFGTTDDRVLPADAPSARASQLVRESFSGNESAAITVVAPDAAESTTDIDGYAATLSRLAGVDGVDAATGSYAAGRLVQPATALSQRFSASDAGTWLSVVPTVDPYSGAGKDLVRAVRETPSPLGPTYVGGASAEFLDTQDSLAQRLPWAIAWIAGATFILLFLFTGSVVLPLKALLLNVLSLSATFGAMVFVFQEGHLQWLVGDFQVTGSIDTAMPILMFCIAFGLSMDYEVFLLARIKEEYDRTGDNTRAVAVGLQRTGRIVTVAALLLSVVFLAFATSQVTLIKMLGLGVALAVLMDATLVRGLMVPAFMRLAGDWNWWAPRPLRRLHARFGLREHVLPAEQVQPPVPETVA